MAETDPRGCFGYKHYPEHTNRFNYALEEIISIRQRRAQEEFMKQSVGTPWSHETWHKLREFVSSRRKLGCSGDLMTKNAWFDDNQGAALRPFFPTASRIQREAWTEFNIAISAEKSKFNAWETTLFEATVGVDIRARARTCNLPQEKVDKYCKQISEILTQVQSSEKRLAPRDEIERIVGRAIHACEPLPRIWTVMIDLIPKLVAQSSFKYFVQVHPSMEQHFTDISRLMKENKGRPLTSKEPRPGGDGWPVLMGASDASRRVGTFFGAAGGWFRFWGSQTVFFFTHRWSPQCVEQHNISELEFAGANILAYLADTVVRHMRLGTDGYYLYQFGDNESVFKHCLNGYHAGVEGMRRLLAQRGRMEEQCNRISVATHIFRDQNSAGDALANLDEQQFATDIRALVPNATLIRLEVPADIAALP
eukprot:SAG31_NODE_4205_length_3474_cov_8.209481_2_plen_423_part_00